MDRTCDKCGELVPAENDAVELDILLGSSPLSIFAQSRHLLPTETCEGSPSRAQYLRGQSRDTRAQYPYDLNQEARVRLAYAKMTVL